MNDEIGWTCRTNACKLLLQVSRTYETNFQLVLFCRQHHFACRQGYIPQLLFVFAFSPTAKQSICL